MKRVFAIVLIVCLAMTAVFADKGDFKLGVQAGYGNLAISIKKNADNYYNASNGGFYLAAAGDYAFSDAFSGKVEFGINTMGKATARYKGTAFGFTTGEQTSTASESSPMQVSAYVGLQYNIDASKDLDLGIGAGLDMMIGKESKDDDAKTNAAMGVGFEFIAAYKLNKSTSLTFGTKFGILFINSDDDIEDAYTTASDNDVKVSQTSFKIYLGLTFAL